MARRLGYDLKRGRLDQTHHPFCTKFSIGDVRITTRVYQDDLGQALFSTLHEAGHALYEQGVRRALEGTPLGRGASSGVHESQSRLWENLVGRSRAFWEHFYPLLRRTFPDQLAHVPLDAFYRAINKVERSLIRTDADEVTYNLHIMLRFDLELKMLEGRLTVKDLPEAWREGMRADLGLVPADDRDGCLQDMHWYFGTIGGQFQSYTLGNILSAQFHAAAVKAHPEIAREIEQGSFGTLHGWLRDHIYQHGRKYQPERADRAGDRWPDEHGALSGLSSGEVRRDLSLAAGGHRERATIGRACPLSGPGSCRPVSGRRATAPRRRPTSSSATPRQTPGLV